MRVRMADNCWWDCGIRNTNFDYIEDRKCDMLGMLRITSVKNSVFLISSIIVEAMKTYLQILFSFRKQSKNK